MRKLKAALEATPGISNFTFNEKSLTYNLVVDPQQVDSATVAEAISSKRLHGEVYTVSGWTVLPDSAATTATP